MFLDFGINTVIVATLSKVRYKFNKIPVKKFQMTEKTNSTIHMETQTTTDRESNVREEEHSWGNHSTGPQITLQTYSDKDSMLLTLKQLAQRNRM